MTKILEDSFSSDEVQLLKAVYPALAGVLQASRNVLAEAIDPAVAEELRQQNYEERGEGTCSIHSLVGDRQ